MGRQTDPRQRAIDLHIMRQQWVYTKRPRFCSVVAGGCACQASLSKMLDKFSI